MELQVRGRREQGLGCGDQCDLDRDIRIWIGEEEGISGRACGVKTALKRGIRVGMRGIGMASLDGKQGKAGCLG